MVVPCAPALLPGHRGLVDPLSDVRAASLAAVAWLVDGRPDPVVVLAPRPDQGGAQPVRGVELASYLLAAVGHVGGCRPCPPRPDRESLDGRALLVLADGSARRGERAPGLVDERAFGFDAAVGRALRTGDLETLRHLDVELGAALLAEGVPVLRQLAGCLDSVQTAEVTYDDDPFGVQYWVARWQCLATVRDTP